MSLREEYKKETGRLAFDRFMSAEPACTLPPQPDTPYVEWLEQKVQKYRGALEEIVKASEFDGSKAESAKYVQAAKYHDMLKIARAALSEREQQ